jgi:RNA polymerase sigma-70 factor, ECF subfamily
LSITDSELRELQDKDLAIAFKRGDSGAYEAIYQRHRPKVEAVCRRMLQNQADAQEASQEAFLRVYKGLSKFNGRYQLSAWITRVTTNVCLDQLRAKSRRPSDPHPIEDLDFLVEQEPDGGDPATVSIRSSEGRRIRKVLESLPPMHRAAIVLRDFEGLSYDEIADVLDISSAQTKALIHRARQNFKRTWTGQIASILLPWRLISKMRGLEPVAKEPAAQAMASSSNFALQCSVAIQQCGTVLADRMGTVVTAAIVGTTAVTAAAVPHLGAKPAMGVPTTLYSAAAATAAMQDQPKVKAKRVETNAPTEQATSTQADPPPPAIPTPAPTESSAPPVDSGESDTAGGQVGGGEPPAPTPSPTSQEPSGFNAAIGLAVESVVDACGTCLRPTQVTAESGRDDEDGLTAFSQTFTGNVVVAGEAVYGTEVTGSSSDMVAHGLSMRLWTSEGSFDVSGVGSLVSSSRTDSGGYLYTFAGTYRRGSGAGSNTSIPTTGEYTVSIVFSATQHRIVSTSISL